MGLDYSFALIFKRQDVWKLLEAVAKLSSQGTKHTSILFPDHTLKLPFETWAATSEQIFFDDAADQWDFMTCLDFQPDEALIDYSERNNFKPGEGTDGSKPVSIGIIYLTVFNDPGDWGGEENSDLIVLQFMAATSNMSILFSQSTSIRAAMIRLLEQNDGVCGILDREDGAELIWWHGQKISVELPYAYLEMSEIEQLIPPESKKVDHSGVPAQFCLSCGREFEPSDPGEMLCAECRGESPSSSGTLIEADFKTMLEPDSISQPEVAYCIIHGGEFFPSSPGEVICPMCAEKAESKPTPAGGATEFETPPAPGPATFHGKQAEWQPGDLLLDTYTVSSLLGAGGMGNVYRVHHNTWNIDLAVKSPHSQFFQTREQRELFISEAETWVKLGLHPHITTCYYVRSINDIPRIFAELVEGGSLSDWIEQGKITNVEQALDIAIQFAWGLAYAHEHGLVHRDVKPANVLMTPDGTAKVTDFGLAKAGKGMTPAYASPEQAEAQLNEVELTPQSDLWSWALSILEIFAGRPFWVRSDMPEYGWGQVAAQALEHYLSGELKNPTIPDIPDDLVDLLSECFRHEPNTRPASMDSIAARLVDIYTAETGEPYPREKPKITELRAGSLNNRALSLLDLGRKDEAVHSWQESLQVDPTHTEANLNFADWRWSVAALADDEILAELAKSESSQIDKPDYWNGLAKIHAERGAQAEVRKCFERSSKGSGGHAVKINSSIPADWPNIALANTINGHTTQIFGLAISPDNRLIASGGTDGVIKLWSLPGATTKGSLSVGKHITSLAFSPDYRWLAAACADETAYIYNLQTMRLEKQLGGHGGVVSGVAFSANGKYLLTSMLDVGSHNGSAQSWDWQSGRRIITYTEHQHWVISVVGTPDGLALSAGRDQSVRLWDPTSGRTVRVFERIRSQRMAEYGEVVMHAGKVLWTGSDGMVLWDYASGKQLLRMRSADDCAAISPFHGGTLRSDGRLAVSFGGENDLRFWDTTTGRCLRSEHSNSSIGRVAFIGTESLAVTCPRTIQLWDVHVEPERRIFQPLLAFPESGVEAARRKREVTDALARVEALIMDVEPIKALAAVRQAQQLPGFAHEDVLLKAASRCGLWGRRSRLREIWGRAQFQLGEYEGIGGITALRFSADSKRLAAGQYEGQIGIYNTASKTCERVLERHIGAVSALVFLGPDQLLSLSRNGDVLLWDLRTGKGEKLQTGVDPREGAHLSALLAEDGSFFALLGMEGFSLRPLDLNQRVQLETRSYRPQVTRQYMDPMIPAQIGKNRMGWPFHSTAAPDGSLFAATWGEIGGERGKSHNPISLWKCQKASGSIAPALVLRGHASPVSWIEFSDSTTWVGSADLGGTIKIWDLNSGACRLNINQAERQFTCLAFSPDSRWVISGDTHGLVSLWEVDSGRNLFNQEVHKGTVQATSFARNGRFAATGGYDNRVQLWELDYEYDFPTWTDWDPNAQTILHNFLARKTPRNVDSNSRSSKPSWSEDNFQELLFELAERGYGWLRPEGVRRKLEEMARERS